MTRFFLSSLAVILLSACTTVDKGIDYTCLHKDKIKAAAQKVIDTIDNYCPIDPAGF